MNRTNYNMKEHGFVGHLSIPEQSIKYGVIVIMGGEQSMLPGTLIEDRFADYGIAALAVSLFGAEGLSDGVNQISLDMFIPALKVLKDMQSALPSSVIAIIFDNNIIALSCLKH